MPKVTGQCLITVIPLELLAEIVARFPDRFKSVRNLRSTCRQFRGLFCYLPRAWWKQLPAFSYAEANAGGLLTQRSLAHAFQGGGCPRQLSVSFLGQVDPQELTFAPDERSKECIIECETLASTVAMQFCVNVLYELSTVPLPQTGCTLGPFLKPIDSFVRHLCVSAFQGTGLAIDQVFPNAEVVDVVAGVCTSNLRRAFPAARQFNITSTANNADANGVQKVTAPPLCDDATALEIAKAHVCYLPAKGVTARQVVLDGVTAVDTGGATMPGVVADLLVVSSNVPVVVPAADQPAFKINRARFASCYLVTVDFFGAVAGLSMLRLDRVHLVSTTLLAAFPATIKVLHITNCTASEGEAVYSAQVPAGIECLTVSWRRDDEKSVRFNFAVPILGCRMKKLILKRDIASDAACTVDLTGATSLSAFMIEIQGPVNMIIPRNIPLDGFAVGNNVSLNMSPFARGPDSSTSLTYVMLATVHVADAFKFIVHRTHPDKFANLTIDTSRSAALALMPVIITNWSPTVARFVEAVLLRQLPNSVKPAYAVLMACLQRQAVSQADASKVDKHLVVLFAVLFPRSFGAVTNVTQHLVGPESAWMATQSSALGGAPQTAQVRDALTGELLSSRIRISPSDRFEHGVPNATGHVPVSKITRLIEQVRQPGCAVAAVRAMRVGHVLPPPALRLLYSLVTRKGPDSTNSLLRRAAPVHMSTLAAPLVIAVGPLPMTAGLSKSACRGILAAATPGDVRQLVSRHVGYAVGQLNLTIVTSPDSRECEYLTNLGLIPLRASAIVVDTVVVTGADAKAAQLDTLIQASKCGDVEWVTLPTVQPDAATDAILFAACVELHTVAHVGRA